MTLISRQIGEMPLFNGLGEGYLNEIISISERKKYEKGELIFNEGDPGEGFYIVDRGKVKIYKLSFGGKEQILHIYGPGKPFGEVPVFEGRNFPASAIAIIKSELFFFPRKDFVALISKNPSLSLNMLAVLSRRLREFTVMVENLALKEVPARLASYLVVLSGEQDNSRVVTLPVSKNQLAGLLGTTPETLSRIFTRLSGKKIIEVNKREITIMDFDALAEISSF